MTTLLDATTVNGAISADWTLAISFGIIGFLLISIASMVARHYIKTLDKIDKSIESLTKRVDVIEDNQIRYDFSDSKWNTIIDQNIKMQNEILGKIRAITPD